MPRNRLFLLGFTLFLLTLTIFGAGAQTPSAPSTLDPRSADVAGVKLGMTPDETINAINTFDSGYKIVKFFSANGQGFGYYGVPIESIQEKQLAYFIGVDAIKDDGHNYEEIYVLFSPIEGNERSILVSRAKQFEKPVLMPMVGDSILQKYSKDVTFDRPADNNYSSRRIGWRFDAHGRVMAGNIAHQQNDDRGIDFRPYVRPAPVQSMPAPSMAAGLGAMMLRGDTGGGNREGYNLFPPFPQTVGSTDGVKLDVTIGAPRDNFGLANGFAVVLYKGADIYKFNEQAQAIFKKKTAEKEAERQKQELEKAKNSQPATKF